MKPIPISSCPKCKQELWTIEGKSEGVYKCEKCGKETNLILRRKKNGK